MSAPDKSLFVDLILKSSAYFLYAIFIKSRSDTPRNDGNKTNNNAKIGAVSHHLELLNTAGKLGFPLISLRMSVLQADSDGSVLNPN